MSKERKEFVDILKNEFPNHSVREVNELAIGLMRNATTIQLLTTISCGYRELTEREEKKLDRAEERIHKLCENWEGLEPDTNGDIRGYMVKVKVPSGYSNSFAGKMVLVPHSYKG